MNNEKLWAISPRFDLSFFILPFLGGILYAALVGLIPTYAFALTAFVWIMFAQTHFGSTWSIYMDKKNRTHYRAHAIVYYLVPALIMLGAIALTAWNLSLLLALIAVFSLYHVSRQSIGILQIYRARNKEFDVLEKRVEMAAIFSWSILFATYGSLQLPNFQTSFGAFLPWSQAIIAALSVAALSCTLFILFRAWKREANSLPKNLFLALSCLIYMPYLFLSPLMISVQNFEIATLTGLMVHYTQYIGLVWLVNRNRYTPGSVYSQDNPLLASISQSTVSILIFIVSYALLMGLFHYAAPQWNGMLSILLPGIVSGLMLTHFFIDSFIWRFRDPFIKETVGPFVKPLAPRAN